MPIQYGLKEQTTDRVPGNLVDLRLYASRAPDLNTSFYVLSCRFEIAQKVERDCQSDVASYHKRRVILLLRQRVDSFGNPHRCSHLVSDEGITTLTHQCGKQEHGMI